MGLRLERASCGLMLLVAVLAGPSLAFAVGEMHLAYFKVTWSTTPGVWQITPHRFELDQLADGTAISEDDPIGFTNTQGKWSW